MNLGSNTPLYVEIAVALPVFATYTYRVPEAFRERIDVGKRVLAPFQRRTITGYVLGPRARPAGDMVIKDVLDILDDVALFPPRMVPFFKWVADYYMHPLGEVIQTALPGGLTVTEQCLYVLTESGRQALNREDLDEPARVFLNLAASGPCRLRQAGTVGGKAITRARVNGWVKKGWLTRSTVLSGGRGRDKTQRFVLAARAGAEGRELSGRRREILALLSGGALPMTALKRRIPTAAALVRAMARDGQVLVEHRAVYRDPFGDPITPDKPPALTREQAEVVAAMAGSLGKAFQTFVLDGVTGSGKTEVYLHLAAKALELALPVIVLVPEIALISQMERAFRARFGDQVALLHSGLSKGERHDQWRRIRQGRARIAIGARSSIFAPFTRVGLVVVDEEHDESYKQEGSLRYNARDMAVVRARQDDAVVVLGSATPSLQSVYNAEIGKFRRLYLRQRVEQCVLPRIDIQNLTDLREERGVRRLLSPMLLAGIEQTLKRREQVLLFLNRRGFAGILICADCGQPLRCERCDISLTYHQDNNAYKCHYCGFSKAAASRCPRCLSARINRLGMGTEKLEEEIAGRFSGARIARMDRDTTRAKGAIVRLLKALREQRIDILIGTQMVAKGHDYPNITLVGVICADLSLNMPDFRAGERTFQLLAQVAGRAGRGRTAGRVILQTYNPDHFSILAARQQDFDMFYRREIEFRKALRYPPFTRMIQLRVQGGDKKRTAATAAAVGTLCVQLVRGDQDYAGVDILGPLEAPLARIAGQYRWQLLLKAPGVGALHRLTRALLPSARRRAAKAGVFISVDVDPFYLM